MTLDTQLTQINLIQLLKSIIKTLKKAWSKPFSGTDKGSIKEQTVYAVAHGDYRGEFFVLMEKQREQYMFLSLPDLHVRSVSQSDVEYGLHNEILEEIEPLPTDVYMVCQAQYRKNKKKHK